jgi:pyruvate formate lyase activating enzyme
MARSLSESIMSAQSRLTEPTGKEAELFRNLPGAKVQCTACARLCQIGEGQVGLCGVRGVVGGKLYLLVYGKVMAGHIDPIEKKPVVHYKPGSKIFSIATSGCNWLCHPKGAQILLADGTKKNVEDILPGDMLWSYNTESGMTIRPNVVTHVGTRQARLWEIRYGRASWQKILLTSEHPVLTADGWKEAKDLRKGDSILKVWYQNTKAWKERRSESIEKATFHCARCGEISIGIESWNSHRGECYTRDLITPPEIIAARSRRMKLNNPMRDPDVAKRALQTSKERFLRDETHGWHRNVERMATWLHRHPSYSQRKLYEILDELGVSYEREFRIRLEKSLEGSKSYYFADVAFPDLRLDVEVDGWWHYNNDEVRKQDAIRDEAFKANGWTVLRLSGSYVYNHPEEVKALVAEYLAVPVMQNKKDWVTVRSAVPTERVEQVFGLETIPDHNYVADGILVHNCKYCFSPETPIVTDQGISSIGEIYDLSNHEGEIGVPRKTIRVLTQNGNLRRVAKVFRHEYSGELLRIRPYYLPEIRVTPNHGIFVYDQSKNALAKKRADELLRSDFLAIPRLAEPASTFQIDNKEILANALAEIKGENTRTSIWSVKEEDGRVSFGMSKGSGIPRFVELDQELAELLGIYCAEGSATRLKNRPNSWVVTFSFGIGEVELIARTEYLLRTKFGVKVSSVEQGSEIRLVAHNNALAVFFEVVAGPNKYTKKVPKFLLFNKSESILRSFLDGYVRGDGYTTQSGKQRWLGTTSVSKELSLGVWYTESRLGLLPRFYTAQNKPEYVIEGRTVSRHNDYLTRVMLESRESSRLAASKMVQTNGFTLVPIRTIEPLSYTGYVYNLEVEEDHSYCASFVAVSNCQNYDISQRRKIEGTEATPEEIVEQTEAYGCEGLAYTYNQPTIFMEYARDVGKIARSKGIFNIFVSNGFDTPETVAMMDDFLDCITVDFKGSGETNFVRGYIGIPNAEPIFQTLLEVKRRGKVHTEITDLIVPRVGDSLEAAEKLCRWVYDNLGPDMPIHFLRFHPDYKMMDFPWTPIETLEKHYEIGRKVGLNYVYIGNVPGHKAESTYCPGCGRVLIERYGYEILGYNLDAKNRCRFCGYATPIIGPLSKSFAEDRFISVIN